MKEKRWFIGINLSKRMKIILFVLFILCMIAIIFAFYSANEYFFREQKENYWGILYEGERDLVEQIIDNRSIDFDSLPEGTIISKFDCSESGKVRLEIEYPNEKRLKENIEIELSNDSVKTTPSDFSSKEAFIKERLAQKLYVNTTLFSSILIGASCFLGFLYWIISKDSTKKS